MDVMVVCLLDLSKTKSQNKKLCLKLWVLFLLQNLQLMVCDRSCKILEHAFYLNMLGHTYTNVSFFLIILIDSSSRNRWVWTCWSCWYIDSTWEVRILGWSGQCFIPVLFSFLVTSKPIFFLQFCIWWTCLDYFIFLFNFASIIVVIFQKAAKWSERKDAVAELTKLASTKRIAPGDFTEVCRTLKKVC